MSFSNVSFILNKPQLSENVGACARAIKNFNFKKLIIINPRLLFPNDKILATSVGAKEIIKNCKVYDNFDNAIKKIDFLIATSSRFRNKNIKHINLKNLEKIDFNKKVGFLFWGTLYPQNSIKVVLGYFVKIINKRILMSPLQNQ